MKILLVILALLALASAVLVLMAAKTVFQQSMGVGFLQAGAFMLGSAGVMEAIDGLGKREAMLLMASPMPRAYVSSMPMAG